MPTYNGINIPNCVNKHLVISAFQNEINEEKVLNYTNLLLAGETFTPITGYPKLITKDDVGKVFMNGEEVLSCYIGHTAWFVTDGHHRVLAAIQADMTPMLNVRMDTTCFTDEEELKIYQEYIANL